MANVIDKSERSYDAIVVGSGISGGWAAKELTEKGLRTLVLERGRLVEHVKDYPTTHLHPWQLPPGNELTRAEKETYSIQKNCYVFRPDTKHFFVNDSEQPYVQDKPFHWIRGYQVGGKSLMWSRHVFRLSDLDFEANAKEGIGIDWPIRYRDLESWYSYVERFIGVSGERDGLAHLPDQEVMSPLELNCLEKHVKQRIKEQYKDLWMISSRAAVLTQEHMGRGKCMSRNLCARGCPYGAYFSSNSSTLPAAAKTGKLTLRPHSAVHSLIYDEQKGRATGVRVVDTQTHEMIEYSGRLIFLNGSTLNTTAIMMNSVSSRFPNGFANGSGVLGHYLMDHNDGAGCWGMHDGMKESYYKGRKPNGTYIPRFQNLKQQDREFLRGYAFECLSDRQGWERGEYISGFGSKFKDEITHPGGWEMVLFGMGETLPEFKNKVSLDKERKDAHGLPLLHIDLQYGPNELAMRKDMEAKAKEILEKSGFSNIISFNPEPVPGNAIHEMGTARMGKDPKTSVLNAWNQCHEARNVFVTDGSCMSSSPCQNPSLTYMALTARACDYAVKEINKGNL